jgi:adenylylsulfate kinase-like enzyme
MMGEITDFTGVDQDYEIPLNPEIMLDTDKEISPLQCSERILQKLKDLGYLEKGLPH